MKTRKKAVKCVRKCWKKFCLVVFCEKHLVRDIFVLTLLVCSLGVILGLNWYLQKKHREETIKVAQNENIQPTEEESVADEIKAVSKIQSQTDTSDWIPYQNTWYGFSLKYPSGWSDPKIQRGDIGAGWEQKIQFRSIDSTEENPFEGFDVAVYSLAKTKELSATEEFPKLHSEEMSAKEECFDIAGHFLETGDYPAEEIYIPINDACYGATLFFTNTRGNYTYNIIPKIKEGMGLAGDPSLEISSHMPEFFSIVSNWDLIDIQRPKIIPKKSLTPKVTAPLPYSFKNENGRRVCAKNNDHPSKSDKHKGKHMDMECCLDPDEYPNPNCHYDPQKYGKYL